MWTKYRLIVPLKSRTNVIVQSRLRVAPNKGITASEVSHVKQQLEFGIQGYWNRTFLLVVDDPACAQTVLPIEYRPDWVTSGEHRVMAIHRTWPREYVLQTVVNVGLDTSSLVFAHEFGHLIGKPDEYSYANGVSQKVRYTKPDGTQGDAITVGRVDGPSVSPDNSIMEDGSSVRERHGWSVAIEAQDLLSQKLGRKVRCSIKMAVKDVGF